jgi:hypothetical protein
VVTNSRVIDIVSFTVILSVNYKPLQQS